MPTLLVDGAHAAGMQLPCGVVQKPLAPELRLLLATCEAHEKRGFRISCPFCQRVHLVDKDCCALWLNLLRLAGVEKSSPSLTVPSTKG